MLENLDLAHVSLSFFANVGVLVAITISLVGLVKQFVGDSRFHPLVSLLIGIGLCLLVLGFTKVALLAGVLIGLAASGLYDHKSIVTG